MCKVNLTQFFAQTGLFKQPNHGYVVFCQPTDIPKSRFTNKLYGYTLKTGLIDLVLIFLDSHPEN